MRDQSSVPPEKPPAPNEEPDDEGFVAGTGTQVPADTTTEPHLLDKTTTILRDNGHTVKATSLKVDHPYGDGKYSAPTLDTLKKLGAGTGYGE